MTDTKLELEGDGFAYLANALLLGYFVRGANLYFLPREAKTPKMYEMDLTEGAEFKALREVMYCAGVAGDWVDGGFSLGFNKCAADFNSIFKGIESLAAGENRIARLAFKDIHFSRVQRDRFWIGDFLDSASHFDLNTPIARVGRTDLTLAARHLVIDHYSGPPVPVRRNRGGFFLDPHIQQMRESALQEERNKDNQARARRIRELHQSFKGVKSRAHLLSEAVVPVPAGTFAELMRGLEAGQTGKPTRHDWQHGLPGLERIVLGMADLAMDRLAELFPDSTEKFGGARPLVPWMEFLRMTRDLGREMLHGRKILCFGLRGAVVEPLPDRVFAKRMPEFSSYSRVWFLRADAPPVDGQERAEAFVSDVDARFVVEGVDLVQSRKCRSANAAASVLVARYGCRVSAKDENAAGEIQAASENAAVDRLGRKILKVLKRNG